MAFTPNPNLFVESFGGGLRAGSALTDLIRQKRNDRELQRLAQLAKQGDYESLGAGLIGMGEVGPGIAAGNVPFQREQQRLEAERQAQQQQFENNFKLSTLGNQNRDFYADEAYRQEQIDLERAKMEQPNWTVSDGVAVNKNDPTQTVRVDGGNDDMFSGSSVQAQALNHLITSGKITRDQAAELAAGRQITMPDGSVWFLGASGLVTNGAPNTFEPNRFNPAPPAPGTPVEAVQPQPAVPSVPPGGVPDNARQLTPPRPVEMNVTQAAAARFADSIREADTILEEPAVQAAAMDRAQEYRGEVPIIGNSLISSDRQRFNQAAQSFINAILRRESGAVISPSEFANAQKQYLPKPGDSPQLLAQKARNRKIVLEGLVREAGRGYQPPAEAGSETPPQQTQSGVQYTVEP